MFQLGPLAVGRKGGPAAAPGERFEHFAHAAEGFDALKIFGLVDLCLVVQDLFARGFLKMRNDNLKGLIAI